MNFWRTDFFRDLTKLLLIGVVCWLTFQIRSVLFPIFAAALLAYLVQPLLTFMEGKWGIHSLGGTLIILSVFFLITAGFITGVSPILYEQGHEFAQNAPKYLQSLREQFPRGFQPFENSREKFTELFQNGELFKNTQIVLGVFGTFFSNAFSIILAIFLIPIYFFFFSWKYDRSRFALDLIPNSKKEKTLSVLQKMDHIVGHYFRARIIVMIILSILFSIGWWICGVPYSFIFGIIGGILSFVPYLAAVSWLGALLVNYLEFQTSGADFSWLTIFVWPSVVYLGVQMLEGWLITPYIQGKSTNLHPLTILIVLIVGGALSGIMGMLFAIPIAGCIKILYQDVFSIRINNWVRAH